MVPMVPVYGYGKEPHRNGVLMAMCPDEGFAADICSALRSKHPDQWFGYIGRNGDNIKQRNAVQTA